VKFVSVYKTDSDGILWELLLQRKYNISHKNMPTPAEHVKFIESKPYRFWFLIEVDGQFVGMIYLSKMNEIGVGILEEHKHKGYGIQAVTKMVTEYKPLKEIPSIRSGQFIACVNPENQKAIEMFSRIGFGHIGNIYRL